MEIRTKYLVQDLKERGTTALDTYLDELLKLYNCITIPKSKGTEVKRIVIYQKQRLKRGLEDSEDHLTWSQIGEQDMWQDQSSNKCRVSFCGDLNRA